MRNNKHFVVILIILAFVFVQCKREPLVTNPEVSNLTDYKSNDGKISLRISGGKPPYQIKWTDNNTDSIRTKLKAGTYYVTITDAKENTLIDTIKIKEPLYPVCLDSEGNSYITEIIGNQVWMIENLRVTKNSKGEKLQYIKPSEDIEQYGLLYNWKTAMANQTDEGVQGICPDGWHIPTNEEWTELMDYVKTNDLNITNVFNLQYGGFNNNGVHNVGESASYWSSTKVRDNIWKQYFHKNLTKTFKYYEKPQNAISLRCIRNKEFVSND